VALRHVSAGRWERSLATLEALRIGFIPSVRVGRRGRGRGRIVTLHSGAPADRWNQRFPTLQAFCIGCSSDHIGFIPSVRVGRRGRGWGRIVALHRGGPADRWNQRFPTLQAFCVGCSSDGIGFIPSVRVGRRGRGWGRGRPVTLHRWERWLATLEALRIGLIPSVRVGRRGWGRGRIVALRHVSARRWEGSIATLEAFRIGLRKDRGEHREKDEQKGQGEDTTHGEIVKEVTEESGGSQGERKEKPQHL
jgi:hypothetical protein